jgi:steroid delta-isomerase-like uncharacterized protein
MGADDAAELVERLHLALREPGGAAAAAELFAPDFFSHNVPPGMPQGVEGVRRFYEVLLTGMPDLSIEIDELIASGDRAAVATTISGTHTGELLGIPASGRRVAVTGIDMIRVAGGRIVEHRGLTDTVGLLRQIGAAQGPAGG